MASQTPARPRGSLYQAKRGLGGAPVALDPWVWLRTAIAVLLCVRTTYHGARYTVGWCSERGSSLGLALPPPV